MPTVFERIDTALSGNAATGEVDTQAGNLLGVATLLTSLTETPPSEVGDLTGLFASLSLPDFAIPGDFAQQLTQIQAAVPADASGIVGGVLGQIGNVETEFAGALAAALGSALAAFEQVRALTDVRLSCAPAPAGLDGGGESSGGEGGGGTEAGGGAGGEAPAEQPTAVAAAVQQSNAGLDQLPDPLTVRSLLTWAHDATRFPRLNPLFPAVVPIVDDIRDPLDTLIVWESSTPAEILTQIESSLDEATTFVRTGVDATVSPLLADLSSLTTAIPADDLERIAVRLTTRLAELRAAVAAGDLTGTGAAVTEINTLADEYDVLRPTLAAPLAGVPALRTRLLELAGDLDMGMASMVTILRPGGAPLARVPSPAADALEALETWLTGLGDWLENIANAVDLSVIQEPIATIADGVRDVAEGLQQAIIGVTVQVQSIFAEAEALLDAIDPAALETTVQDAVQSFRDELVSSIDAAVGPARDAVLDAVAAIDTAVDAFDPAQIIAALTDAVNSLASVLTEGEVGDAITQIRSVLEDAATQLESLSFAPVGDTVVDVLDGVTSALRAIDPALLPGPAASALQAAASVLPPDLETATNPLLDEFGEIVDAGPVAVLEQIRDQPARVLDAVRAFDPASLIGDDLSAPFEDMVRAMEQFRPSELLEPVETELESLKERLRSAARPGLALAALEGPFEQLRQAFDSFDPDAILAPIDEALSGAMERLLAILPVDETFDVVDEALSGIRRVIETAQDTVALVRRVREMMNGLLDVRTQLDDWVDEVLDRVDAIGDASSLTPRLTALGSALDDTTATAIGSRFTAGTATARAALDQVGGLNRLSALIEAHRSVSRSALAALPASPDKTAVTAALDRFDPMLPDFGAPYRRTGELRSALAAADTELAALLTVWDDRFHAADGSLDALRHAEATPAQLRTWAAEALETQFVRPVAAALGVLEPARRVLDVTLGRLESLITTLTTKLEALLLGPGSLGGIRDALGSIVTELLDLDLEFLRTSVRSLFDNVRAKLDNISPERLAEAFDAAFDAILDAITIDLILPPADLTAIDDTYEAVLDRVRALDPAAIVTAAVQPIFDETVLPLLEMFDLSPFLDTIIDALATLDDELREELGRVNTSYKAMLAAVPSGGSQSASVSVGVG